MPSTWILIVDGATGVVRAENTPVVRIRTGPAGGRPCHAVMALPGCRPGCPADLFRDAAADEKLQEDRSRRGTVSLMCSKVGDEVLIAATFQAAPASSIDAPRLTERELEVLHLVSEGYSSADIARILGLGAATVRTHVEHVRGKLQARTRAEAAARAVQLGLIQPAGSG